jgi:hypothetical protein
VLAACACLSWGPPVPSRTAAGRQGGAQQDHGLQAAAALRSGEAAGRSVVHALPVCHYHAANFALLLLALEQLTGRHSAQDTHAAEAQQPAVSLQPVSEVHLQTKRYPDHASLAFVAAAAVQALHRHQAASGAASRRQASFCGRPLALCARQLSLGIWQLRQVHCGRCNRLLRPWLHLMEPGAMRQAQAGGGAVQTAASGAGPCA